jgi:hypothetical protein
MHLKKEKFYVTNAITKSFGWNYQQSYQQHDAQELFQALFTAITESCKGSEVDGFVEDLFSGFTMSIIKCLECGNESFKQEKFQ